MCCVVIRWVDLMAKTITSVSRREEVIVEGHKMMGADYRYKVLKTLCDLPWPAETAISLLSVIKLVLLFSPDCIPCDIYTVYMLCELH